MTPALQIALRGGGDQSNGPILWGEQGACKEGSVLCGKVVYICVLLKSKQTAVFPGGGHGRRREGSERCITQLGKDDAIASYMRCATS